MKVQNFTRNCHRSGRIICGLLLTFLILPLSIVAIPVNQDKIDLEEAFLRISEKYQAYFNYDRSIAADIEVDYTDDRHHSLDEALSYVLKNTDLGYRIYDERYVVVFQNNDQGIESLKSMIGHMQGLVEEKEISKRKKVTAVLQPLQTLSSNELYNKRIVFNVSGTVTDQEGEPLIGVNIQVKGTNKGASTDFEGHFTLEDIDENAVLVVSYIGYQTQEVNVGGRTNLSIVLSSDSQLLDEVVVVGYGEQSRRKMTTAVSKVSGNDINQLPVANTGEALAGLAAGVQVQSGSGGKPGDAPIIRIRGIGSLGASNTPLFVVDGYPLQNANQFMRIDVADIESIEVLKDAASAAIYGSRAANGVIIVTTKKGRAGEMSFNINAYTGIQSNTKRYEMMNIEEYVQYSQDAHAANGKELHSIFDTPEKMANTNWQDLIFRNAPMTEVQISANGGSDRFQFLISGSYQKQQGILVGTDYQIANFRTNLNVKLVRNLRIGVNFAPSFTYKNDPSVSGPNAWAPIYAALLMPPYLPGKIENGEYVHYNSGIYASPDYSFGTLFNPLGILEQYERNIQNFGLFNNAFISFEPIKHLEIKSQGGIIYNSLTENEYVPSTLRWSPSPEAGFESPSLDGIRASTQVGKTIDWVWENTLNYTRTVNERHNFNALLLFSLQNYRTTSVSTNGRPQTFTNDLVKNSTASIDQAGSISYGLNSFVSYAGRISYDYNHRYLVTGSIRSDGSSRFGPDMRFGVFKSFSIGWRISEENFMQNQSFFDELKVRASYGETGNANIGNFAWVSGIQTNRYSYAGERVSGSAKNGFLNRNLTWERNNQMNIGIEASFLDDRIYMTVDAYKKVTNGMLFDKELPAIVGYAQSFTTNIGEIQNKGLELDIKSKNVQGNLVWSTDVNLSFNKTKVLDLGGRKSLNTRVGTAGWSNVYRIEVGQPIGNMYGFIIDGVFRNEEDLENYPSWTATGVGDYKIRDVNNDGVISEDDRTLLGNGFPDVIYGITNRFTYQNFDLSFIFQGVLGSEIINGASRHTALWVGRHNAVKDLADNYFDPSNPNKEVKYARVGNRSGFSTATELHSYAVYDGDYLRLRNLTVGYTFSKTTLKKMFINSARLYLTGQNLLTFTGYPGYNPEPSQYGSSVYQPGSDQAIYPVPRSIILGVNLNF